MMACWSRPKVESSDRVILMRFGSTEAVRQHDRFHFDDALQLGAHRVAGVVRLDFLDQYGRRNAITDLVNAAAESAALAGRRLRSRCPCRCRCPCRRRRPTCRWLSTGLSEPGSVTTAWGVWIGTVTSGVGTSAGFGIGSHGGRLGRDDFRLARRFGLLRTPAAAAAGARLGLFEEDEVEFLAHLARLLDDLRRVSGP